MDYFLHIVILIGLYTILAISLDLLAGHTGVFSLSQAAFWGIGAYSSALLTVFRGTSFLTGMLIGMILAAIISLLVSLPSIRLHDDYFVVATLGFQVITFDVFNNWMTVTKGPYGIAAIPPPTILGFAISTSIAFAFLVIVFTVLSYMLVVLIIRSPLGRVLRAIREDEVFARAMGKSTTRHKVTAFAVSAMLAAVSGSLFAHYSTYIEPNNFTVSESILVISMVIIGGAGSVCGPFAGAAILIVLPEALRFLGFSSSMAANMRQIIYGLLLILIMMFRPKGIVGRYRFKPT
jgi:branched-chain amino acid transport system permease protein